MDFGHIQQQYHYPNLHSYANVDNSVGEDMMAYPTQPNTSYAGTTYGSSNNAHLAIETTKTDSAEVEPFDQELERRLTEFLEPPQGQDYLAQTPFTGNPDHSASTTQVANKSDPSSGAPLETFDYDDFFQNELPFPCVDSLHGYGNQDLNFMAEESSNIDPNDNYSNTSQVADGGRDEDELVHGYVQLYNFDSQVNGPNVSQGDPPSRDRVDSVQPEPIECLGSSTPAPGLNFNGATATTTGATANNHQSFFNLPEHPGHSLGYFSHHPSSLFQQAQAPTTPQQTLSYFEPPQADANFQTRSTWWNGGSMDDAFDDDELASQQLLVESTKRPRANPFDFQASQSTQPPPQFPPALHDTPNDFEHSSPAVRANDASKRREFFSKGAKGRTDSKILKHQLKRAGMTIGETNDGEDFEDAILPEDTNRKLQKAIKRTISTPKQPRTKSLGKRKVRPGALEDFEDNQYIVKEVMNRRSVRVGEIEYFQYKVKWFGYSHKFDSWIDAKDLAFDWRDHYDRRHLTMDFAKRCIVDCVLIDATEDRRAMIQRAGMQALDAEQANMDKSQVIATAVREGLLQHTPPPTINTPTSTPRSKRWKATPAATSPVMPHDFPSSGTFLPEERNLLDRAVEVLCENNSLTRHEINDLIQVKIDSEDYKKLLETTQMFCDMMWETLKGTLPKRKDLSVQKYCKRTFHNASKRGSQWTAAEDRAILDHVAAHERNKPTKQLLWKSVADTLGRRGEDCRDRYRDYLKFPNLRRDAWDASEEAELSRLVAEDVELLAAQLVRDGSYTMDQLDLRKMERKVNWEILAGKLGTRNRHMCNSHWQVMKKKERRGSSSRNSNNTASENLDVDTSELSNSSDPSNLQPGRMSSLEL